MNKSITAIVAAGAMALPMLLGSCGSGTGASADGSKAKGVNTFTVNQSLCSAERYYSVKSDYADSVYLTVSAGVQWPEKFGNADLSTLRSHLLYLSFADSTKSVGDAILAFVGDTAMVDQLVEGAVTPVDAVPEGAGVISYFANVSTTVTELNERYVTYNVVTSSYLGGAHPMAAQRPFTFDLTTGQVLTFDNMFKPGTTDAITKAIRESLGAQYNVSPDDLERAGFFGGQPGMPGQPYVSDGAVVFHYNAYDIAPYSHGAIDVPVYPYQLDSIMTPTLRSLLESEF